MNPLDGNAEAFYNVGVVGAAKLAFQVNASRTSIRDICGMMLEVEDSVRQIQKTRDEMETCIFSVAPSLPTAEPLVEGKREKSEQAAAKLSVNDCSSMGESNMLTPVVCEAVRLDETENALVEPRCSIPRAFPRRRSIYHFTRAVDIRQPVSIVASEALNFVAKWRQTEAQCNEYEQLVYSYLDQRLGLLREEEDSRYRLQQLWISVSEQINRFLLFVEYDRFVVFCLQNEPVWRQAARRLQKENEARLKTTAFLYNRFLFTEKVMEEKIEIYQVAADFIVSLKFVEMDKQKQAHSRAMARRRQLSAPVIVHLPQPAAPPTSATLPNSTDPERGRSPKLPREGHKKEKRKKLRSSVPEALPQPCAQAVECVAPVRSSPTTRRPTSRPLLHDDQFTDGWRALFAFLSSGEKREQDRKSGGRTSTPQPHREASNSRPVTSSSRTERPAGTRVGSAIQDRPVAVTSSRLRNNEAGQRSPPHLTRSTTPRAERPERRNPRRMEA